MKTNQPGASDFDGEIGALALEMEGFNGVTISAVTAPTLRDVIARSVSLAKRIDKARVEQKAPHLQAGRDVDADYKPVGARVADIGASGKKLLQPFLLAEQNRLRAEAEAKAKADAEKAALDAFDENPFSEQAPTEAVEPVKVARATVASASGLARSTGLRTYRTAKVTDAAAMVAHYAGRIAVIEAAEKLANEEIRAAKGQPVNIPGVTVQEDQRIA